MYLETFSEVIRKLFITLCLRKCSVCLILQSHLLISNGVQFSKINLYTLYILHVEKIRPKNNVLIYFYFRNVYNIICVTQFVYFSVWKSFEYTMCEVLAFPYNIFQCITQKCDISVFITFYTVFFKVFFYFFYYFCHYL